MMTDPESFNSLFTAITGGLGGAGVAVLALFLMGRLRKVPDSELTAKDEYIAKLVADMQALNDAVRSDVVTALTQALDAMKEKNAEKP